MNRKTRWGFFAIFIITMVSALNININTNENGLSDISLDNVEALAQESGSPGCISAKGYCIKNGIKSDYISLE